MKYINLVQFIDDLSRVIEARPKHHEYIKKLGGENRLWAAGPLSDRAGALFIYEAPDQESAEVLVREDPFYLDGVLASYELHPWQALLLQAELPPQ